MHSTIYNSTKLRIAILMGLLFSLAIPQAPAQSSLQSRAAIRLVATLPAQLRLSLADINLEINVADPTQASQVVSIPVTSSWVLDTTTNSVELVGYFDSPESALTDNQGHFIPANHVMGALAGESMAPFVETSRVGTANSSRTFFRQQISRQNVTDSRSDTLNVQLDRVDDLGAPAGEYRGILHLRLVSY
jgi:hypothetical protein